MKNKIENIAKILLYNNISFDYSPDFLKVTDSITKYDLFETASYHSETGILILMDTEFNEVSLKTFSTYFNHFK